MRSQILRCQACQIYTLEHICPDCEAETMSPLPPRYSPEDHYGKYRRALLRMQRESSPDTISSPSTEPMNPEAE